MPEIHFTKAQGLGNDFVIMDTRQTGMPLTMDYIRHLADRKKGIGCDQVILLYPPTHRGAQARLKFYNSDGSEAAACGNGTRCVAFILMEQGKIREIYLETSQTLCRAFLETGNKEGKAQISVSMGKPKFAWHDIPLSHADALNEITFEGKPPFCVNVGNPHAVFFVKDVNAVQLSAIGSQIETHPAFPDGINVGLAQIIDKNNLRLRVWERGSGATLACGTGACAAAVIAIRGKKAVSDRHNPLKVIQEGGESRVHWRDDEDILLAGPACLSFKGTITL